MSPWLQRFRGDGDEPQQQTSSQPVRKAKGSTGVNAPPKDPNVPRKRLQVGQKCLYERTLPGKAYISAHVNRLQHGFYRSPALHDPLIENLYFVSVHFVFHPHDPESHRFKSAEIEVCVHGDDGDPASRERPGYTPPGSHPQILKHAPELMFGAVSPENLQWNFSLSSSLGVSQTPVSASLNPKGAVKSSYKVFHMMSIQGSIRSQPSPLGPEYEVDDARAVWTLTENMLQRSGLPREFDFVLLVQKPDDCKNMRLTVNVDADIGAWYGTYPQWYTNLSKYMPTQDCALEFDTDIGQRFLPSHPGQGFNFANLLHSLDEYVTMPGTVYPTNDTKQEEVTNPNRLLYDTVENNKPVEASSGSPQPKQPTTPQKQSKSPRQRANEQNRHSWAPDNVNVRVVLEHQYPQGSGSDPQRFSYSPLGNHEPVRYPSIRRRKSRTGLKEYSARQALHELAQNELDDRQSSGEDRANGDI
ncbi:hypothetical protein BDW02DRAFT_43820 [Decorospora gaudefroyi]|uniref:Uncharacterized protein n=1 Tax=Decorospora gaudefroyi TaxID=184978 RepID=A0A6A5KDY8_9PLEO|nr:hypothetical protein BDW02DRAFT_43820 [Decorospora gaudefroyi]